MCRLRTPAALHEGEVGVQGPKGGAAGAGEGGALGDGRPAAVGEEADELQEGARQRMPVVTWGGRGRGLHTLLLLPVHILPACLPTCGLYTPGSWVYCSCAPHLEVVLLCKRHLPRQHLCSNKTQGDLRQLSWRAHSPATHPCMTAAACMWGQARGLALQSPYSCHAGRLTPHDDPK